MATAKLSLAVLALVAVQVLCAQSLSIGAAGENDLGLDLADKGLGSRGLDADLGRQRLSSQRGLIDVTGVLRSLQGILDAVNEQIQKCNDALVNAITATIQQSGAIAEGVIDSWNRSLQAVIDGADALDEVIQECEAQQPNLRNVSEALDADKQECVQNASQSAQAALLQLKALGPLAESILDQAVQDVADCQSAGLLGSLACLALRLPPLGVRGLVIAGNATILSARVTGELAVRVPLKCTACVTEASARRGLQAAAVIDRVRRCIQAGGPPTTTAESSSSPSSSSSSTDASSPSSEDAASSTDASSSISSTTSAP